MTDPVPPAIDPRYAESWKLLERAERVIPLGSQTFSKSRTNYPEGAAPLFLERGEGCRVWDVDGNEYVDMVGGLLPVVLGYCDPDVDEAIRRQLSRGITFSLATRLEVELAERLVEIIPCAEKVRFGKNGTDATSAAVRLSRAFTGRDRIAIGGYHGWQDWYIGATVRNKGVPEAVAALTHRFAFNDLAALERTLDAHPGEFAAVILEPLNAVVPDADYLAGVRDLAHRHGALLVFDEIITGFRAALGGAQSLYGVVPDLACFGKSMANGMPISTIVGRAEVMNEMENVFVSGTFGGETLSLAAAIATIDKMRTHHVIDALEAKGAYLNAKVRAAVADAGLEGVVSLNGVPAWTLVGLADAPGARKEAIKTLFIKEMLREGVLMTGSHNISYAHGEADLDAVAAAWRTVLGRIREALDAGDLEARLPCPAIQPVFSVRATA